ncbi:MAG: Ig-like domain-containing protein [Bryobacteraceae bacterium]|nr:Ig-like domain-containing protein [Bryobacteraceae bacterium]
MKWLAPLTCLFALVAVLQANDVFVLPDGVQSQTVNVYSANPLAVAGSFPGPQGRAIDTLASPDSPVTYWTYGDASIDTVVGVDQAISPVFRSGVGNAASRAAVVTPNGRYLLVAAGAFRVFDTATRTEVNLNPAPQVGADPVDIAVSVDSRYAFVLSSTSQRLTRVSLENFSVASFLTIGGQPTAVAVGPDGYVYLSTTNEILIIDGNELNTVGAINLNGVPAKVHFTPDGKTALAINRTPATNVTVWIIDVAARALKGTIPRLAAGAQTIAMDDRILVLNNERAVLTSRQTQLMYRLTFAPAINIFLYEVGGIGSPTGVLGATVSHEMPPRNLFFATANTLYRVQLSNDQRTDSVAVTGNVRGLAFARQPSRDVPTTFIQYNTDQTIGADAAFKPIAVRALDELGRPVFGAPVVFSTTTEGVTIGTPSTETNLDGLAMTTVNHGEVGGRIVVTATIGTSLTANFTLIVSGGGGGGGGGAGGIAIVSGNGQLLPTQFITAEPFRVRVTNAAGEPVAGAAVEWQVVDGQGTLLGATPATDQDGYAIANYVSPPTSIGQSYLQTRIRATSQESSVEFFVTAFPTVDFSGRQVASPNVELIKPALDDRVVTGRSGETVSDAIRLRIVAAFGINAGQGIPNVKMTATTNLQPNVGPVASCAGGEPLSDAQGFVSCNLVLSGRPGTSPLWATGGAFREHQLTLVMAEPLPTTIEISSGNNQSGLPGTELPQPLVALVKSTTGAVVGGATVVWEVVSNATLRNVVSVSDAQGRVSANVTLGSTVGPAQVRVRAGNASATFSLTVRATATSLVAISGAGQTAVVGQQFAAPLVVELRDANNAGVAGQNVAFQVTSGGATLSSQSVQTNAQGRASVNVTAGSSPGSIVVSASYGDLPAVTFALSSRLAGPAVGVASFVNGASGAPGLVPGSIARIVAPGLAPNVQNCVTPVFTFGALPLELAQVTVQFGPDAAASFAPIYYVCNVQGEESVAIQVPFELTPGTTSATIRVSGGSSTVQDIPVLQAQPGIFEAVGPNGLRYGVALRPNGSYVSPQNPARRGEIIALFATGLGRVDPAAATNSVGIPGQRALERIVVGVNNQGVRVLRGEYAPNMIGIYIVFFEIPADTATGLNAPLALAVEQAGALVFANGSSIAIQ